GRGAAAHAGLGESLVVPDPDSAHASLHDPLSAQISLLTDDYFDGDGAGYVAIFAGQSAEVGARDYYDAIKRGALKTRIADAEVVTAKKVVSFPQKRRRPVR